MKTLTPSALATALQEDLEQPLILDVREASEVAWCQIPGSLHIPMGEISGRFHELDRNLKIVVLCHHGMRSAAVVSFLEKQGFDEVFNLTGGIDAWSLEVDPSIRRY